MERDEIISSIIQQADDLPPFPSPIVINEDTFLQMMKEVSQVLIKPIVLNATLTILANRKRIIEGLKLLEQKEKEGKNNDI